MCEEESNMSGAFSNEVSVRFFIVYHKGFDSTKDEWEASIVFPGGRHTRRRRCTHEMASDPEEIVEDTPLGVS